MKTKQRMESILQSHLYCVMKCLYMAGWNEYKRNALISYMEAKAICATWNELHPRSQIFFSKCFECVIEKYNQSYGKQHTLEMVTDELLELYKNIHKGA